MTSSASADEPVASPVQPQVQPQAQPMNAGMIDEPGGGQSVPQSLPVVLYLCYGPDEIYDQAKFSILSLIYQCWGKPRDHRVVVYCDRPKEFSGWPVELIAVSPDQLELWLGGSDYIHRRKICAIIDALERTTGKVVFIDTDTYFLKSPSQMFARIGPGQACFHICEGFLLSTGSPPDTALGRQLQAAVYRLNKDETVTVGKQTRMWNTGVVGVHFADLGLMRAALQLSDAIWAGADPQGAYGRKIHHGEQFAMGYAFRNCRLSEAQDCIYHYWPELAKKHLQTILPEIIRSAPGELSLDNLRHIYNHRYCEPGLSGLRERMKMTLRKLALAVGVPIKGVRRST